MTIDNKIRDEKLQYDINRQAAKISALSSGKVDQYEYLTGEEILLSDQRRVIEQAKFTYSPLGKIKKIIEDQGRKQIDAITNQNERLAALSNKDNLLYIIIIYYYFKSNTARKRFDKLIWYRTF